MLLDNPMESKLGALLRHEALSNPDKALRVIVVVSEPSTIDELINLGELQVTRVLRLINGVAGHVQAKDLFRLSQSPIVRSIELDHRVSIEASP